MDRASQKHIYDDCTLTILQTQSFIFCLIASRLDLFRAGSFSWLEIIFPITKNIAVATFQNYPLSTFARIKKIGSDEFSFILEGAKIHQKIDQAHFKMATDS